MGKYKYIRADVYRRGITVFVGTTQELLSFVEDAYSSNESLINDVKEHISREDTPLGTTYVEELGLTLIWIPKFPKTPKQIANLSHEVLHATFHLLDYIDVEYRYNGPNEPYTYLFEYFLEKALTEKGYKSV